jgi:hypothetical protein
MENAWDQILYSTAYHWNRTGKMMKPMAEEIFRFEPGMASTEK